MFRLRSAGWRGRAHAQVGILAATPGHSNDSVIPA
jgi:hypothetical protein